MAQLVKNLPAMQEIWVQSLGWEDPLGEEMATYSSIIAWRIPETENPGRLQSIRSDTSEQLTQRTGSVDPKELSNTAAPVQASETILEDSLLGIRSKR